MKKQITSLPALACFRMAAEFESFSKAADHMNLTHGAVSRAVRLLEDDIGVSLFERRNRSVFLTDSGRKLAQSVASGLGMIEGEIANLRHEQANAPIMVSCEPTLMMRWLIPRMPDFRKAHPDIDVRLVAGGGHIVLGAGIDLAIRRNDFSWPEHYVAHLLFNEQIGPVCRPDSVDALFDGDKVRPETTLLHTSSRRSAWDTWMMLKGEVTTANLEQEFEHFYFSLQAAIAGLGVAIGSWHLVQDDLMSGLLAAPQGFLRDGTGYYLLFPEEPKAASPLSQFCSWLDTMVESEGS